MEKSPDLSVGSESYQRQVRKRTVALAAIFGLNLIVGVYAVTHGALLLLSADKIGRVLVGSGALPVGVITSFLGAPMFLYLLVRGYR